jgi:hypothetical protein
MSKVPSAVSAYLAKIGAKGGRNGVGVKKKKAGALGGKKSGEVRRKKALAKSNQPA